MPVLAQAPGPIEEHLPSSQAMGYDDKTLYVSYRADRAVLEAAMPANDAWAEEARTRFARAEDYAPASSGERETLPWIQHKTIPPANVYRTTDPDKLADFGRQREARFMSYISTRPLRMGRDKPLQEHEWPLLVKALREMSREDVAAALKGKSPGPSASSADPKRK